MIHRLLPFALFFVLATPAVLADTEAEIAYLLSFISGSECLFERNGKTYAAHEARAHIQRKLDYIRRRDAARIRTSEDFIALAATRSSFTGRLYRVECEGRAMPSSEWLLDALDGYRKGTSNRN